MKVASFFSGVGGIDLAFHRAGFTVVWANEIDNKAALTYALNFTSPITVNDIRKVRAIDIPDFDVLAGGFPCQAFSVAGHQKGFEDDRGTLFFELERIIRAKQPSIVFLENVKHLAHHDEGRTLKIIIERLEDAGYTVKYKVMNAIEYGNIPQNRERIYIVGFKDAEAAELFEFPEKIPLTARLHDYISFDSHEDQSLYYSPETTKCYDVLKDGITKRGAVYQVRRNAYVRQHRSEGVPTLTANMGTGGNNVPIILDDKGIRKLSPRECFNLMGFPQDFRLPDIAKSQLYKQAGNSVVVQVVERIAKAIRKAAYVA